MKVPADAEHLAPLRVSAGFTIGVFARDLLKTRILEVADNGDVYVTRRDQGDILLLRDADGNGEADGPARWIAHRPGAHGIAAAGEFVGEYQRTAAPLK